MAKQTKITKSAKGEECTIRLPGICNFNPETVVLCHIGGAGMALKANDIHSAYGCSSCHSAIDGHVKCDISKEDLTLYHYDGMVRTQLILLGKGLLVIK